MSIAAPSPPDPLRIAVIGTGVSGLSAAWLLSRRHEVTVYEAEPRVGGHCHTVDAGVAVDTGFIVYNEATYPNLTALFRHLEVPTRASDMSFGVSIDDGRLEYSGTGPGGLFAQRRNLASPRFWSMLREIVRFYRRAPRDAAALGPMSLEEYLRLEGYGRAFREDHLYPMAAAIWSTPAADIGAYPAAAFIRFCENHGLLRLRRRPVWRTVTGGSRTYVERLARGFADRILTGRPVRRVLRQAGGIEVVDGAGEIRRFDRVVLATHADQALALLGRPTAQERLVLGAFAYRPNRAVLHSDPRLMPRRRSVWSSWNYLSQGGQGDRRLSVTYWMNRLQRLDVARPWLVTLNPAIEPDPALVAWEGTYDHPVFDGAAIAAQDRLWSLQGAGGVWYCGAYFGAGFHEDGLQAGLAVAEALGGGRRPWSVAAESGRIRLPRPAAVPAALEVPA